MPSSNVDLLAENRVYTSFLCIKMGKVIKRKHEIILKTFQILENVEKSFIN
jgi:hypothetical protein